MVAEINKVEEIVFVNVFGKFHAIRFAVLLKNFFCFVENICVQNLVSSSRDEKKMVIEIVMVLVQ